MTSTTGAQNVLTGCRDPYAAYERARTIVRDDGGGDSCYWAVHTQWALAAFLHAAVLGDVGMADVLGWVIDPVAHQRTVTDLLCHSSNLAMGGAYRQVIEDLVSTNERSRRTIRLAIMSTPELWGR